ncbi:MAG: hypothetical protein LR017_00750 [Candidatus Pacebacteria bacterium]|nr:hypothetical protein [Candidatus Paceibacterota bacterium]
MVWATLHTVFRKPLYAILAAVVSLVVFTFSVWLSNLALVGTVLASPMFTVVMKAKFLLSLYGVIGTNFTTVAATYTILIAILFGINVALLTYYIRTMRGGVRSIKGVGATSLGGVISGFFGIGCAACGSFLLTAFLALFGATGLLAYLPFGGEEFGFLGVVLLLYTIYMLCKKIEAGSTCPVDV